MSRKSVAADRNGTVVGHNSPAGKTCILIGFIIIGIVTGNARGSVCHGAVTDGNAVNSGNDRTVTDSYPVIRQYTVTVADSYGTFIRGPGMVTDNDGTCSCRRSPLADGDGISHGLSCRAHTGSVTDSYG